MAGKITSLQAAEELGVTKPRIFALIKAGRLPAERFGNVWMIDPADLEQVRERPTGRPPKGKETPQK